MSREHYTAVADLNSAGVPRCWRQQTAAGNHPLYSVGVPVPQQAELLEKLEQTCLRLGRPPTREELVPALRIELTATFGSLRSALLQLGQVPSPRPATPGLHRKRWKRKKTNQRTSSI